VHDVHVYGVLMGDVLCGDGAHNAHVVDNPLRFDSASYQAAYGGGSGSWT